MTAYLEFLWPYCLFTIQLLWGYDNDVSKNQNEAWNTDSGQPRPKRHVDQYFNARVWNYMDT